MVSTRARITEASIARVRMCYTQPQQVQWRVSRPLLALFQIEGDEELEARNFQRWRAAT